MKSILIFHSLIYMFLIIYFVWESGICPYSVYPCVCMQVFMHRPASMEIRERFQLSCSVDLQLSSLRPGLGPNLESGWLLTSSRNPLLPSPRYWGCRDVIIHRFLWVLKAELSSSCLHKKATFAHFIDLFKKKLTMILWHCLLSDPGCWNHLIRCLS